MLDKIMNDRISELRGSKVVMFGAGRNARRQLDKLIKNGIIPAYFVDNNPKTDTYVYFNGTVETFVHIPIYRPDAFLKEYKKNLKILITPDTPLYEKIEKQIGDMGFGSCITSLNARCCHNLAKPVLRLDESSMLFCCAPTNDCNNTRPSFPYLKTARGNIDNYFKKRESIIEGLNGYGDRDIAEPCIGCKRLGFYYIYDNLIRVIDIGPGMIRPPCNACCIYCNTNYNPQDIIVTANNSTLAVSDYAGYKNYVYVLETKELIRNFKKGVRVALLGRVSSEPNIVAAFKEMDIPLQMPDLGYEESYDNVKDSADIFIINNRNKYNNVKAYMEINGGNGNKLLDIGSYYFSFEPSEMFLKNSTINEE